MGFRSVTEIQAFNLSVEFKRSVYALVKDHPAAARDANFREQLFKAAAGVPANIAEGFGRRKARAFRQFLTYARGSVNEALTWISDGIDRAYYSASEAHDVIVLGRRTAGAIAALQRSLKPFLDQPNA